MPIWTLYLREIIIIWKSRGEKKSSRINVCQLSMSFGAVKAEQRKTRIGLDGISISSLYHLTLPRTPFLHPQGQKVPFLCLVGVTSTCPLLLGSYFEILYHKTPHKCNNVLWYGALFYKFGLDVAQMPLGTREIHWGRRAWNMRVSAPSEQGRYQLLPCLNVAPDCQIFWFFSLRVGNRNGPSFMFAN